MSVRIEHLSKAYGNQLALNDISFEVNPGEIVGLIGPNGAGKSTLMKIICSLLLPTSGKVFINDILVTEYPDKIKKYLGYLPENNPLYNDMFVKEYLYYIAGLYNIGSNIKNRVNEVIKSTGLEPEMHKKIGLLSKGYKQRVGLAQAIIHDPKILILDEPTTGLDPNQIVEVRNLILELGREKTVILSTHIMQEVEAICQKVIILKKGEIVANDLTGEIGAYLNSSIHTIIVEFNNDTDESIFKQFIGINKALKVKPGKWILESDSSQDIREDLFKLAVNENLIILSMHRKDKKLEDVFHDLTS